jgi:hypothetical protein
MTTQLWDQRERLTPWVIFDLERIAWVVEHRSADLTPEEQRLLRAVAARLERVAREAGSG